MTADLSTSLAETINQSHADCMACDEDIRTVVLHKVNKARECGLYLIEAKASAGHGQWARWVAGNLRFGDDTALAYMRFARANPEEIRELKHGVGSLTDAMYARGALAEPHRVGQQQRITSTWLDRWSSGAQTLYGLYNAAREKIGDVTTWPAAEREAMKAQIEPLVRVYEQL